MNRQLRRLYLREWFTCWWKVLLAYEFVLGLLCLARFRSGGVFLSVMGSTISYITGLGRRRAIFLIGFGRTPYQE